MDRPPSWGRLQKGRQMDVIKAPTAEGKGNFAADIAQGIEVVGKAMRDAGLMPLDGIGDINSQEKGSGARYNAGKPDLSLIPMVTLEDEARVWEYGKKKYAAWNWTKGMDWSVPFACAMRHMAAWQRGEECDPESGLPHLAHAMCNLRMLTLYATTYPQGDDRPSKELLP